MATQTQKGKAFEYACLKALHDEIRTKTEVFIDHTTSFTNAMNFYEELPSSITQKMDKGANSAIRMLLKLEPLLLNPDNSLPLELTIQGDKEGMEGDVRDVLCIRQGNQWEIGLSCKHNHSAVKHSRLSEKINFGSKWFEKSCSSNYFEEIAPIFERLRDLQKQNINWRDMEEKEILIYMPLLDAFVRELKFLDSKYPNEIPTKMVQYLLGRHDFYKIITDNKTKSTTLQAYNLFNTLNRQSTTVKALQKIPSLPLPTKLYDISYKNGSKNTVIVTCDEGWAFSFRIHNASTKVEPSLKFDIQIAGMPPKLYTQIEPWEEKEVN